MTVVYRDTGIQASRSVVPSRRCGGEVFMGSSVVCVILLCWWMIFCVKSVV
jgi:hypothetical protein